MTNDDQYFADLAARVERGDFVATGPVDHSDAGRDATRAMLLDAAGVDTVDELMAQVRRGRPRLGEEVSNVTWKVRAPRALDDELEQIVQRSGKKRSTIIREAVAAYTKANA